MISPPLRDFVHCAINVILYLITCHVASHSWKEKGKGWVGQPPKWYLMDFPKEKKRGRKNKGNEAEMEGILERGKPDEQWQNGGV